MNRASAVADGRIARGCLDALQIAGDPHRLAAASAEQLNIAATFLARALARFEDEPTPYFRAADSLRRLEAAGRAIGMELRRRGTLNYSLASDR